MNQHHHAYETANEFAYRGLRVFAKNNRHNMTQAESVLWNAIRQSFKGIKFRRQHVIGDYIADFICLRHNLVIEVDGGYHNQTEQQAQDRQREQWLTNRGYKVIRFTNEEVLFDTDNVINKLNEILTIK